MYGHPKMMPRWLMRPPWYVQAWRFFCGGPDSLPLTERLALRWRRWIFGRW